MREIKYLVIHCSATKSTMDIGAKEIKSWHVGGNKWTDIGYHHVIRRNGVIEAGRPIEKPGAHVSGFNSNSIGICLVGGVDAKGKPEENYTGDQWSSLKKLVTEYHARYPKAEILGHRDFAGVKKACPVFDTKAWVKKEGIL